MTAEIQVSPESYGFRLLLDSEQDLRITISFVAIGSQARQIGGTVSGEFFEKEIRINLPFTPLHVVIEHFRIFTRKLKRQVLRKQGDRIRQVRIGPERSMLLDVSGMRGRGSGADRAYARYSRYSMYSQYSRYSRASGGTLRAVTRAKPRKTRKATRRKK